MFLLEKLFYLIVYGTTDPEGDLKRRQIERMRNRRK
jgi:hypothetical protein